MAEKSNIAWTDSTINFWSGCTMVPTPNGLKDSGCLHCYAKDRDDRQLQEPVSHWGAGAPRLKHVGAVKNALAMNRNPFIKDGSIKKDNQMNPPPGYHRRRIFSNSLSDWLDAEVPIEWFVEMLDTIYKCGDCTWILCTKRPENFFIRMEAAWKSIIGENQPLCDWIRQWAMDGQPPMHVILLTSVENQEMADKRIPELLKIPAACRGLSIEPLLSTVDLSPWIGYSPGREPEEAGRQRGGLHRPPKASEYAESKGPIHLLIIGCESGPHRRFQDGYEAAARSLIKQGQAAGVAVFHKQMPIFTPEKPQGEVSHDTSVWLDDLRVQQWPRDLKVAASRFTRRHSSICPAGYVQTQCDVKRLPNAKLKHGAENQ